MKAPFVEFHRRDCEGERRVRFPEAVGTDAIPTWECELVLLLAQRRRRSQSGKGRAIQALAQASADGQNGTEVKLTLGSENVLRSGSLQDCCLKDRVTSKD